MADFSFKILADISAATKSIEKFSSTAAKEVSSITSSFSLLTKAALGLGAVFAGGIGIREVINEAAAFEESVNSLRIAFNLTGIESEKATESFVDFAGALQETTRFGDDQVLSAASLIQSLGGLTENGLKQATKAAADLSTALGIDLQTAAQLVGKAAAGEIGTFGRYGLSIKEGATDAETFANALTVIQGKFGGASEQAVNSYAGSIDQLKNNFSDAVKELGLSIIQNKEFIGVVQAISKAIISSLPTVQKFGTLLGTGLSEGLTAVVPVLKSLPEIIGTITTALVLMNAQLLIASAGKILVGIKALIAGFTTLVPLIATAFGPITLAAAGIAAVSVGVGVLIRKFRLATEATKEFNEKQNQIAKDNSINEAIQEKLKFNVERTIDTSLKLKTTVSDKGLRAIEEQKKNQEKLQEEFKKSQESFKAFSSSLVQTTLNDTEKVKSEQATRLAELQVFRQKGVVTEQKYNELTLAINEDASKKLLAIEQARVRGALNVVSGFINNIGQGAQGAIGAISSAASIIGDSILPGLGGVASQVLFLLAQGPEKVRETIVAFIEAIPAIIENIIASIPVLIDAFVEQLPILIERLAELLPQIAIDLGTNLANQMPFIATKLAFGLIQNIPNIVKGFIDSLIASVGRIVSAIADGVKSAISGLTGGGSVGKVTGGITGAIKSFGKKLGFAEGGVIPTGFPNDSFPAQLSSGEGVVPNDTMRKLDRFLSNGGGGGGTTIVKIVVGEQELASVLLNLNRQGFRTT